MKSQSIAMPTSSYQLQFDPTLAALDKLAITIKEGVSLITPGLMDLTAFMLDVIENFKT